MPFEGHTFIFNASEGDMRGVGIACSCGWSQGLRGDMAPKVQWLNNHVSKKSGLRFFHEDSDLHYDFEDKESWCDCGQWEFHGPDMQRRALDHLQAAQQKESAQR